MGQLLIEKGMVTKGTLWSATALVDENLNDLVVDSHLEFIDSGAEIIVTNNFKVRKNTFRENGISDKFDFANKRAGELALRAKKNRTKKYLSLDLFQQEASHINQIKIIMKILFMKNFIKLQKSLTHMLIFFI